MAGKITATDAARRFSEFLNQVRYQGVEFDIVRGKEVVARLVPAAPPGGVALDRLDELARSLQWRTRPFTFGLTYDAMMNRNADRSWQLPDIEMVK